MRIPDGRTLFRIDKLDVRQGDRMVLLGRNGVGKSRFAALLCWAVTEEVPGLHVSPSAVLGWADQGMSHLPDD